MDHGKKKRFIELPRVTEFISGQPPGVQLEYADIVSELERNGHLNMPTGEKIDASLFALRVIRAGNVRVFYVYGRGQVVYGIHGYVKKTQRIPEKEMSVARKIVKLLRKESMI